MLGSKSKVGNIPAHVGDYYEETASQEETYLEEAVEELCAVLTSDNTSPSRDRISKWAEIRVVRTSDGPENAMFCAGSVNRTYPPQGRTQC